MNVLGSAKFRVLVDSFTAFNQVSHQLETSYHQLGERVAQLRTELAAHPSRVVSIAPRRDAERFNVILKSLPAGVVVIDGAGLVAECNPAAEAILGVAPVGQLWRNVVAQAFNPQSDDGHDVTLSNGKRVNLSTCPLGTEPGQLVLLTDVTETRGLQERLAQLQRLSAVGEMAAALAHQVRTPIASGLLYASQLKNNRIEPEQRSHIVDKLTAQLRQLEGMVKDMLLFSRTNYAGDESFAVGTVLARVQEQMAPLGVQKNINFTVAGEAVVGTVRGNSRILQSALENLVHNAVQALPQGGNVTVIAEQETLDAVDIRVLDDGPGIPVELHDKVFEPFFTTRSTGTGLGLAIVRVIARAHGGDAWINAARTTGCEIVVRLPLVGATR